jgi:deoxyribose-phosphate aldolase
VADGADALDVVVSLPLLANGDYPAARDELARAVAAAASAAPEGCQIAVRAVIEACYLEPAAWRLAARLAVAAGCGGVVCATGLGPEGATPAAIAALCAELPAGSAVKAQGGIRVLADAQRALAAGADLLGVADPASLLAELAEAPAQRRRRAAS